MSKGSKLFVIKDNDGKYVDQASIWQDKKNQWHYNSHNTHYSPCMVKNIREEAEKVVDMLKMAANKAGLHRDFIIEEFAW